MSRITLSDGSSWPRPALESDEELSIEWKLRYRPLTLLTPEERMEAASIIAAYNHLVFAAPRAKRDLVCREIRQVMREENHDS